MLGLQEHMKSIHRQTLTAIPNAVGHRMNPATVPAEMTKPEPPRMQPFNRVPPPPPPPPPPQRPQPAIPQPPIPQAEPAAKRIKVDAPLDAQTIQTQLASFQRKKEQQQIQDLISSGAVLPPGLPPHEALSHLGLKSPPPGAGLYPAKPAPQNPITPATFGVLTPVLTTPPVLTNPPSDGKPGSLVHSIPSSPIVIVKCVFPGCKLM
jgi:hypothetical protein